MSKFVIQCGWQETPHLTEEAKEALWATIPIYQRQARSEGIPELGAGAIYPLEQRDIMVPDFPNIPDHWARVYGMDFGWNWTAAVWGAWDRDNDKVYIYKAYKRGHAEPIVHADAIKGYQGIDSWIPGVCDPAGATSGQLDGYKALEVYKGLGLNIEKASNSVESGIMDVWNRLSSNRLKVFASLGEFFAEYSLYRRESTGKVHKENDHLMDCLRYLIVSGLQRAIPKGPNKTQPQELVYEVGAGGMAMSDGLTWLGS